MITAKEREEAFRKEFLELLHKHEADFDYDPDNGFEIYMWSREDEFGNIEKAFCSFLL